MTATEVRRNWFRVLDEVLAGETIVVERSGGRVVLRAEGASASPGGASPPDYSTLLCGDVELADRWTWDWPGSEGELRSR
jgi:hypothetical protein